MLLRVEHTWDGQPLPAEEVATVEATAGAEALEIRIEAPYHADPPPAGPPGARWALWEHEVVELFVLGAEERYTEIEVGPHGHHLVLRLEGRRNIVAWGLDLALAVRISANRWTAHARLAREALPAGPWRVNAYAIHGQGGARRYLASTPVRGDKPDFHRWEGWPAFA